MYVLICTCRPHSTLGCVCFFMHRFQCIVLRLGTLCQDGHASATQLILCGHKTVESSRESKYCHNHERPSSWRTWATDFIFDWYRAWWCRRTTWARGTSSPGWTTQKLCLPWLSCTPKVTLDCMKYWHEESYALFHIVVIRIYHLKRQESCVSDWNKFQRIPGASFVVRSCTQAGDWVADTSW